MWHWVWFSLTDFLNDGGFCLENFIHEHHGCVTFALTLPLLQGLPKNLQSLLYHYMYKYMHMYIHICTYSTHLYLTFWVHLALFVRTCAQGWPLGTGHLYGSSSLQGNFNGLPFSSCRICGSESSQPTMSCLRDSVLLPAEVMASCVIFKDSVWDTGF